MIGQIFKWFIIVALVLTGLGIIGNTLGLFTKVISTPARVLDKTLDTNNVIQSYEWFYDVNASYKARRNQVEQFNILFSEEEDKAEKRKLRIELAAMQQSCRELVTKYNANSEKMNKSIFKGWSLPDILLIETCN